MFKNPNYDQERMNELNLTDEQLKYIKEKYCLIDNPAKSERPKIDIDIPKYIFFDYDSYAEPINNEISEKILNSKTFENIDQNLYKNLSSDSQKFITSLLYSKIFNGLYYYEHKIKYCYANEKLILLTEKSFPKEEENIKYLIKLLYPNVIDFVFSLNNKDKEKFIKDFLKNQKASYKKAKANSKTNVDEDNAQYDEDSLYDNYKNKETCRYAVISKDDYFFDNFFDHVIQYKNRVTKCNLYDFEIVYTYDNCLLMQILYTLKEFSYSWCHSLREYYHREHEPFNKVIFLDIDGVLNYDLYELPKVIPEMVQHLKYIVDNTNAHIILSSSWRVGYYKFLIGLEENDAYTLLHTLLTKAKLHISGITPLTDAYSKDTRPFEIRQWLARFPNVESFVILDDQTWNFKWLEEHFVLTATKVKTYSEYSLGRYIYGLTKEFADKAIEILNISKKN